MKIKLLRDSKIMHKVGEVVDASPAECKFLISVGSAVKVSEAVEKVETATAEEKKITIKRTTRKINEINDCYSNER